MKKEVYFPWEKVPDMVYHPELTDHEWDLIEAATESVVKNVFRREKNPIKRTALLSEVGRVAHMTTANKMAKLEASRKLKYYKKENYKLKKAKKKKKK